MGNERGIIDLDPGFGIWLETPAGRYLLDWEQRQLDGSVADLFGFHALQLGIPEFDALRNNRMPHRWLAVGPAGHGAPWLPRDASVGPLPQAAPRAAVQLQCHFEALPFPSASLDLVVLPHTLEFAQDPHLTLREVERVLVPEGRVIILGFNPASLWALRQNLGRMRRGLAGRSARPLFMPPTGEFINYWRVRDWLRLLSFEIEGGRFGCYRPPLATQRWLDRYDWVEPIGGRWWPVLGAAYFLVAVKRVRGMRLVGLAKRERAKAHAAPAVVTNRQPRTRHESER